MRLTKHHGLGNDFLVFLDLDDTQPVDGATAAAICDRHRGVGADGLIRCTRGSTQPFRFELRNEDGSTAEMSGNGISCMAQALVLAGLASESIGIDTDAGVRVVEVVDQPAPATHLMRVDMGTPSLGDPAPEWESAQILRAVHVDVGNPHLVCHVPDFDDAPDLAAFGARANEVVPGGVNVEFVGPDDGGVRMTVYERGVGPTQACGTGAVATALAASHWGLAPSTMTVDQPGGVVTVEVGAPAFLTVPVVAVAEIVWPIA